MNYIKYLFEIERKPKKGLLGAEWIIMGYLVLTLLLLLFTSTKLQNPESMLWGRMRIIAMMAALWAVYRMLPCRFTRFCRYCAQLALLSWWYPETYEFNKLFPNLDHLFAAYDQQLFGMQPALLFAQWCSHPVFSELMHLGYASFYPLIAAVVLYYFFKRYDEFDRTVFIILGSFFIYYVIFIFLAVAGPQFYYEAVGLDNIAKGLLPNIGDYFVTHSEAVTMPGWPDGIFYHAVEGAHAAGERPTAAFPSSHVGVTTILLFLAWRSGSRKLFYAMLPFYLLMCPSTVYIQAHYVVDVFAGWVSAVVFYIVLHYAWKWWFFKQ